MVSGEGSVDDDLPRQGVGILVNARLVHVEQERRGDMDEAPLGLGSPLLDFLAVQVEPAWLGWMGLDVLDDLPPLEPLPQAFLCYPLAPHSEDLGHNVAKRHGLRRGDCLPDPDDDFAVLGVGELGRPPLEESSGVPSLQDGADGLAVRDIKELRELCVRDVRAGSFAFSR